MSKSNNGPSFTRAWRSIAGLAMTLVFVCAWAACPSTALATPAGGLTISSLAEPTNFSAADTFSPDVNEPCVEEEPYQASGGVCDRYAVIVTNASDKPVSGPITIGDALPSNELEVVNVEGRNLETENGEHAEGAGFECSAVTVACTYERTLQPGDVLQITVRVVVKPGAPTATVTNRAYVESEGAVVASTSEPSTAPNTIDGTPPGFGFQDFSFQVYGPGGATDSLAGDHPYETTTTFDANSRFKPEAENEEPYEPIEEIKDVVTELPMGLVADTLAASRCPESEVAGAGAAVSACPSTSRVGNMDVNIAGGRHLSTDLVGRLDSPLYNVVPDGGYPAQFASDVANGSITLYGQVVSTADGYRLRVLSPGLPRAERSTIDGVSLTFFGDPGEQDAGGTPSAFFTNPTACSDEPLDATMYMDSWTKPGEWIEDGKILHGPNGPKSEPLLSSPGWVKKESIAYPDIAACNLLQFNPAIAVTPSTTQADEPAGYGVNLEVPQAPNIAPDKGTPDLKNATVTLPAGVSLSPAAAEGLESCTEAQLAPLSDEPGSCPSGSQIGTVTIVTPLLSMPLKGQVFVRAPGCEGEGCETAAEDGELFGVFIQAQESGVTIKLKGRVEVGTGSARSIASGLALGQIRAKFEEDPQLPFSDLSIQFDGGAHAVLANPQSCGSAETTSELTPWSAGDPATPFAAFTVTGCSGPMGFAPDFSAGTTQPLGGSYTPFALTLSRRDGEQDLAGVSVTLPPGLAGMVAKVPLCEEPQAAQGTCPVASRIGTATVAAGAGAHPLWLSGPVYLTGAYGNAPFGLSVVVPAQAGPFDLGNVVVRSKIDVNPYTAQVSVSSDPLPQSRDGVPLRLKTLTVTIDRSEFMFNPTNCAQMQLTGSVSADMPDGSAGLTSAVSSPFAAAGCKNLPFHPAFEASAGSKSSKTDGVSLAVKLGSSFGQANIRVIHVSLPKQLPSRLSTLKLACVESVFDANPAACPAGSRVGEATAATPILSSPLTGPAYLVSHGGAAFPDLEVVLQGEGITVILDGKTDIENGITSSTFESVPDAPISSVQLQLPEGPDSMLAAPGGSLCGTSLAMPTTITGQNGAVAEQSTPIAVTGCTPAIRVLRHSVRGDTATLVVSVPSAGRLVARGDGLTRAVKSTGKAATVTIRVRLSRGERSLLTRHPARRLSVRVNLRFTVLHGGTLSSAATVLIG